MNFSQPRKVAIGVLACTALAVPGPLTAQDANAEAFAVRQLDIMLMVSSLVCRHGQHGFQAEYAQFTTRHLPALNKAHARLKSDLTARHGAKHAKKMMDRMGVGMANQYGQGHPWMSCEKLKQTVSELAGRSTGENLHASAMYLLGPEPLANGVTLASRP